MREGCGGLVRRFFWAGSATAAQRCIGDDILMKNMNTYTYILSLCLSFSLSLSHTHIHTYKHKYICKNINTYLNLFLFLPPHVPVLFLLARSRSGRHWIVVIGSSLAKHGRCRCCWASPCMQQRMHGSRSDCRDCRDHRIHPVPHPAARFTFQRRPVSDRFFF